MLQMATSVLDLAGVLLLGVLGYVAVAQTTAATSTAAAISIPILGEVVPTPKLAIALVCVAGVFFLAKSLLAVWLSRTTLAMLAISQKMVTHRLTTWLLGSSLMRIESKSPQDLAYATTSGVSFAVVVLLGGLAVTLSELALLLVLGTTLLVVAPVTTLVALFAFGGTAVLLGRVLGRRAIATGQRLSQANIAGAAYVQEGLANLRELVVSNRRSVLRDKVVQTTGVAADAQGEAQLLIQVPKYVYETGMVAVLVILVVVQLAVGSTDSAVGVLALFLAAASRIMPSMLRLQNSLLTIDTASGLSRPTQLLWRECREHAHPAFGDFDSVGWLRSVASGYPGFASSVTLDRVTFTYPGQTVAAVDDVSLDVPVGSLVALVGATGSGKSTLADLVLGVLEPDIGAIRVAGTSPQDAIAQWPGAMAYMPQRIGVISGTVRDNVALGLDGPEADELIWRALDRAQLSSFLRDSRDGLETVVDAGASHLSGGQLQRLAIARALVTEPKLIVLDEATSALDAETEAAVTAMLVGLRGEATVLIVAHRLATVRNADLVVYLEHGRVVAAGSFEHVRGKSESFDRQARLLGL